MQPENGYKEEQGEEEGETHDRRTNNNASTQTKVSVSGRTRNSTSPDSFMRPLASGRVGGRPTPDTEGGHRRHLVTLASAITSTVCQHWRRDKINTLYSMIYHMVQQRRRPSSISLNTLGES